MLLSQSLAADSSGKTDSRGPKLSKILKLMELEEKPLMEVRSVDSGIFPDGANMMFEGILAGRGHQNTQTGIFFQRSAFSGPATSQKHGLAILFGYMYDIADNQVTLRYDPHIDKNLSLRFFMHRGKVRFFQSLAGSNSVDTL
jgi:hypothetical protein